MDSYDEQEQVEAIKKWIREYGPTIVVGLVLGFALLFGWRYWLQVKHERATAASHIYEQMMGQLEKKSFNEAVAQAKQLISEYEATPYAFNAALVLAKLEISNNNAAEAERQLRWALEHAPNSGMDDVARNRLVRVLIAQQKYDEALRLTDESAALHKSSIYPELKGDILVATGKAAEARSAYEEALKDTGMSRERRALLMMKQNELN